MALDEVLAFLREEHGVFTVAMLLFLVVGCIGMWLRSRGGVLGIVLAGLAASGPLAMVEKPYVVAGSIAFLFTYVPLIVTAFKRIPRKEVRTPIEPKR